MAGEQSECDVTMT